MTVQELMPGLMPTTTEPPADARAKKGAQAFRTISEVAEDLNVPQHVLRFWEGKFPQLKPLKRGGGRRYYRPEDIALLRRIAGLLYSQGYTIKGVQRLLSDDNTTPNADQPPPGIDSAMAALDAVAAELRDLVRRG